MTDSFARFGRLPLRVLVDNGKEFDNDSVETGLAQLEIQRDFRVPGRPGSGYRVEAAFGRFAKMLDNLPGNVKVVKDGTIFPTENDPCDRAKYTLMRFWQLVRRWCEQLDHLPLPSEGVSPLAKCEQASREHGSLLGRLVCPSYFRSVVLSTYKPHRLTYREGPGFRVRGHAYDGPDLPAGLDGRKFEVVLDPRDARSGAVFVAGKWHHLRCRTLEQRWRDLPPERVWALTQELRELQRTCVKERLNVELEFAAFCAKMERLLDDEQARRLQSTVSAETPPQSAPVANAAQMDLNFGAVRDWMPQPEKFNAKGNYVASKPLDNPHFPDLEMQTDAA